MPRKTDNCRSDMLNRIRKNIQSNYSYCDIIYKPTAKQIAFLDDKIFTNERQEFEIIQYRGVKDIEEIPRLGVSGAYKDLSAVSTFNLDEIDKKSDLAIDLFSRWYRQNKNGEA